jgi:hypothetical protein
MIAEDATEGHTLSDLGKGGMVEKLCLARPSEGRFLLENREYLQ